MSDLLIKLEERTQRLIGEFESSRLRLLRLEADNDGLRITAADRDRLAKELDAVEARLASAENDVLMLRRERDLLLPERDRATTLEADAKALRERIAEAESAHHGQLEQERAVAEQLRRELDEIRAKADTLLAEREALGQSLALGTDELEALHARIAELTAQLEEAGGRSGEVDALRAELAAREAAIAERDAALAAKDTDLAAKVSEIAELRWYQEELEKEFATAQAAAKEAETLRAAAGEDAARIVRLEAELARATQAEETAATLAARNTSLGREVEALTAKLADATAVAEAATAEQARLSTEYDGQLRHIADLMKRLAASEAAVEAAVLGGKRLAELEAKLAEAELRARELEAANEKLAKENEDVRLRLNEHVARDHKTRERLGGLIDRLERVESALSGAEVAANGAL